MYLNRRMNTRTRRGGEWITRKCKNWPSTYERRDVKERRKSGGGCTHAPRIVNQAVLPPSEGIADGGGFSFSARGTDFERGWIESKVVRSLAWDMSRERVDRCRGEPGELYSGVESGRGKEGWWGRTASCYYLLGEGEWNCDNLRDDKPVLYLPKLTV
jgi:hypothetical protein